MATLKPGDRVRLKLTEKPYTGNGGHKAHPGDKGTIICGTGDTDSTGYPATIGVMFDSGAECHVFPYRLELLDTAFYLVHSDRGPSTKQHPTKEAAEIEAARLATKHPGTDFYVMAPVAKARAERPIATLVAL